LFGIKDAAPKVKLHMVKPCYGARPVPYEQSLLAKVVSSEPDRYESGNTGNSSYSENSGYSGPSVMDDWPISSFDSSPGYDSGSSDNSDCSGSSFDFGGGDAGGGGSSSDW
jgi:hypothetical protein